MTNKIIVMDVDGTLADVAHRRHFVASRPRNWPAFSKAMVNDPPMTDVIWLAQLMYATGNTVIVCSGRGTEDRQKTETWLAKHGVQYHGLYMRAVKDYRRDDIVKTELLEQIRKEHGEPFLWFDDRQQVVDAIRGQGVRVMQVAPGDF